MQVIHTVPTVSNQADGVAAVMLPLCESLHQSDINIKLIALDWAPIDTPPTYLRTFPLGIGPRKLGRSPAMAQWLDSEVRSGGVDVLHNHGLWMMPNVYPGRTAANFKLPYIVSPHGTLSAWATNNGSKIKKLFWPLVQRPALKAVTCFHATAEHEYQDIRRMGFRQPVAIIPNGVDIPPPMDRVTGEARTLLFLGRIHPVKGLNMLLPAWGAVEARFPDWRLRIVGPGDDDYLNKVHALAVALELKRVDFCGPLFGSDKWQAYAEAELFVLPSYSENFGMSVAEALAAGTPAVVTKGAPWPGLDSECAGKWIDNGVAPLVSALEELMQCNSEELSFMGQRGRLWMERDNSWRTIGRKMADTYRWVREGGGVPAWVITD